MKAINLYEFIKAIPVPDDEKLSVAGKRTQWVISVFDAISAEFNIDANMFSPRHTSVLRLNHIENIGEYIRQGPGWANCFKNFGNIPPDDRKEEFPVAYLTSRLVAAGLLAYINAKEETKKLMEKYRDDTYCDSPAQFIASHFQSVISIGRRLSGNRKKFHAFDGPFVSEADKFDYALHQIINSKRVKNERPFFVVGYNQRASGLNILKISHNQFKKKKPTNCSLLNSLNIQFEAFIKEAGFDVKSYIIKYHNPSDKELVAADVAELHFFAVDKPKVEPEKATQKVDNNTSVIDAIINNLEAKLAQHQTDINTIKIKINKLTEAKEIIKSAGEL